MVALSDEDTEKISAYRNIEAWNNSKANEGFLNYLKGLAAYIMEEKEEAIYRFMWVKENEKVFVIKIGNRRYAHKLLLDRWLVGQIRK